MPSPGRVMQRLSGRVPGGGDGEHGETVPERTEEEDRETERVQEGQGDREKGHEGQGDREGTGRTGRQREWAGRTGAPHCTGSAGSG